MNTKDMKEDDRLEKKRSCLNDAIIKSRFDLQDPDVLEISREVDVIVLREMNKAV